MIMMFFQLMVVISFQIAFCAVAFYWVHLEYKDKLHRGYVEIDYLIKSEVDSKRSYKKLYKKLKKELIEKNQLIWYMKEQSISNRLYKKYFIINNK